MKIPVKTNVRSDTRRTIVRFREGQIEISTFQSCVSFSSFVESASGPKFVEVEVVKVSSDTVDPRFPDPGNYEFCQVKLQLLRYVGSFQENNYHARDVAGSPSAVPLQGGMRGHFLLYTLHYIRADCVTT